MGFEVSFLEPKGATAIAAIASRLESKWMVEQESLNLRRVQRIEGSRGAYGAATLAAALKSAGSRSGCTVSRTASGRDRC